MGKFVDLTGNQYGMLTVIQLSETRKGHTYWKCKCECGNDVDVESYNLQKGRTLSCGCNKGKAIAKKYPDLTGMVFGRLTVLSRAGNKGSSRTWNCKCECGNICVERSCSLLSANTQSCGCLSREITSERSFDDLTGKVFSRLTVLYRVENNDRHETVWRCRCECGTEKDITGNALRSGNTKSCGCYRHDAGKLKVIDITGQVFGNLYVLGMENNDSPRKTRWHCVCECGSQLVVDGYKLRSGETRSCGCIRSKGEKDISDFLNSKNIQYEREKRFETCRDKGTLPFDFYIPALNTAIEYDGLFHYKQIEELGNDLEGQQHRDKIKTQYCVDNGIRLIRIPYWERDNIESILTDALLFNDKDNANLSYVDLSA